MIKEAMFGKIDKETVDKKRIEKISAEIGKSTQTFVTNLRSVMEKYEKDTPIECNMAVTFNILTMLQIITGGGVGTMKLCIELAHMTLRQDLEEVTNEILQKRMLEGSSTIKPDYMG